MKDLKQFNIPFIGLKEESHLFDYQIDNTFFEAFNFEEYFDADINVTLTLDMSKNRLILYEVLLGG